MICAANTTSRSSSMPDSVWKITQLAKYARPMEFEEVALRWPEINLCLAHFGWPWVQETAALLLKYPNLYSKHCTDEL